MTKRKVIPLMVWHPVESGKLPAYDALVLLSLRDSKKRKHVCIGRRYCTDSQGEHWRDDRMNDLTRMRDQKVTAWMQLPESYSG